MINKTFDQSPDKKQQQLKMWRCLDCNAVHFHVGAITLNFTEEEFAGLAEACFEIYSKIFTVDVTGFRRAVSERDDILSSDLIA